MSRLIFDADTLGGTTTLSSEDAVGNFTIDVPAKTGTLLIPTTVGLAGQVLTSNATTAPTWSYLAGTGTVTSINGSGGTTGLTLTGGPITTSGTLTLGGTLIAVNGGTGQSSYVVGDVLYASSTTALSKLTIGTTGQVLTVTAGIPSWATPTTGTVTSVSFTGGVVSVATATTTPALTIAGTSGGVPYFSSATTWATSAALAANALVLGGGAGVAPSTTTTGTGVVTALGVNVGSAGALVTFNGALGTPSSGTVTNLTGTASINIHGTVGATTPAAGTFTTVTDQYGSVRAVPQSGTAKTASYTLVTADVGRYIQLGASGAIVIPDATFAAGDIVSVFNNTSASATITCTITTAYIAGTDADKATVTLATRGVATILFISGTVCVISGNVT